MTFYSSQPYVSCSFFYHAIMRLLHQQINIPQDSSMVAWYKFPQAGGSSFSSATWA